MSTTNLDLFFEKAANLKVLIIGDVMVDQYIFGSASRISAEAPVPIVQVTEREKRLGGAANVALNIASMGATPILCSIIGDDPKADDFMKLMHQNHLPTQGIIRSQKRKTTVKNRIIAAGHQMLRFDDEFTVELDDLDQRSLLSHISLLVAKVDIIIFEDYDKGCLNASVIKHTVAIAANAGIPIAADPKIDNFFDYGGVTLFKPNIAELRSAYKGKTGQEQDDYLQQSCSQIQLQLDCSYIMVTLGEQGIYLFDRQSGAGRVYPTKKRKIADVSGAGDTVIAILGLGLGAGLPMPLAARIANLAGGIVCEYPGVIPINADQLKSEVSGDSTLRLDLS